MPILSEADEFKSDQEKVRMAAIGMTLPLSRFVISGLVEEPGRFGDFRGLFALMIPGAIIGDVFAFAASAIAAPVLEVGVLGKKAALAIDTCIHDHSPDDLTKIILEGYKVRLIQVESLLKGKVVSFETMLALLLAHTAWDSKDAAPRKIILGNQVKLKGQVLLNHANQLPEKSLELFKEISEAAMLMKSHENLQNLSQSDLVRLIADELTGASKENIYGISSAADHLKSAALIAKTILEKRVQK